MSNKPVIVIPDDCETIALAGGPYSNFGAVATPWIRETAAGFWFIAGALGRPAHEDSARVFYGLIDFPGGAARPERAPGARFALHELPMAAD